MAQARATSKGIAFPPRLGEDGRWMWSTGPPNIREAIRIILTTERGERLMLPEFGGGLGRFLYQPNTPATRRLIEEQVVRSLRLWEPRIELEGVRVEADPNDPAVVHVHIEYRLVSDGRREGTDLSLRLGSE